VIRILADALTRPARLVERSGAGRFAQRPDSETPRSGGPRGSTARWLTRGTSKARSPVRREDIVDEKRLTIKVRRSALLGGDVLSSASEAASDSAVELTAAAGFTRRGAETKLVLPGLAQQDRSSRCDPALIKAIARGRAWFEQLAIGRAQSLNELAKREGFSRRYIRRLLNLAFLSPQLVEAILQGRRSVEFTATRLIGLDLPLDWTEQHKLLAS
jgi:hypothetical protein